jgi:hypothetical protein
VRKTFSASPLPLCFLCVLGLFGCSSNGQSLITDLPGEQAAAQPATQPTEHANGIVQDWSMSHVVYPRIGEIHSLIALQHDPRAILSWQAAERQDFIRARGPRRFLVNEFHTDWSISLGTGGMAPTMYPAKYTFNVNATPTCIVGTGVPIPDFVVFTVNVAGSTTQPNIVAFQDLYSGTAGTTGICNSQRPSYFTGDTATSAATFWSYNIKAADGVVSTSPALSLDGTKIAFVEKGSGTEAHFHVLAYYGGTSTAAGDGVNVVNSQDVSSQTKSITGSFATLAPAAGSGTATDLPLGSSSDTLSSPFVDYANDLAYIGNDNGTLFRVKNVFCTTAACTVGVTAAPILDTTWGGTGSIATGCTGVLTGPVVDGGTGNIFVGCSDGKLYGFTFGGVALTGSPLTVGNGSAFGGIVDPPIIDAVNGFVYVVSGSSGVTGPSVLVQAGTTSFISPVTATLGAGGQFNLHAPSFNNAYFSGGTPLIYEWALDSGGSLIDLYGIGIGAGHKMTAGTPANQFPIGGSAPVEFSPITEFLNGANDQLFVSGLKNVIPNIIVMPINTFPSTVTASSTQGTGTSGIIVDNDSSDGQTSSVYFGVLGPGTNTKSAVKLTQSGLK